MTIVLIFFFRSDRNTNHGKMAEFCKQQKQNLCEYKYLHVFICLWAYFLIQSLWAYFSIQMSIIWIYVISHVCPAGQLSCIAKTFMLDITHKHFYRNIFIFATLLGTFDFSHFVPLSVTLTLTEGHKVRACWLHFFAHFSTDQHEFFLWC